MKRSLAGGTRVRLGAALLAVGMLGGCVYDPYPYYGGYYGYPAYGAYPYYGSYVGAGSVVIGGGWGGWGHYGGWGGWGHGGGWRGDWRAGGGWHR